MTLRSDGRLGQQGSSSGSVLYSVEFGLRRRLGLGLLAIWGSRFWRTEGSSLPVRRILGLSARYVLAAAVVTRQA